MRGQQSSSLEDELSQPPLRKCLMVAFHYPPCTGSSGILRTLKFSRYLPSYGWSPVVLSAHPRVYAQTGNNQLGEIPSQVTVERSFAVDAARHLSIRGRYFGFTALPDRWSSWWLGAVPLGLRLVRRHRPAVLWSTYPIATAHWIGATLHRLTGLPWVADLRDSMTEDDYPRDLATRQAYLRVERLAIAHAARLVFTAEATKKMYMERYPDLKAERCLVIPNGYDEDDFKGISHEHPRALMPGQQVRLVHSGLIYPEDRNPKPFLRALSKLCAEGTVAVGSLRVDLRASGHEGLYRKIIQELNIAEMVKVLPPLPYRQSLEECAQADGLILLQAASCNHQVPAKLYEYLRLGKPILALTSLGGETAAILQRTGGATMVDLENQDAITEMLPKFLLTLQLGCHPVPTWDTVQEFSRYRQTNELAKCFSTLAAVKVK